MTQEKPEAGTGPAPAVPVQFRICWDLVPGEIRYGRRP